MTGKKGRRIDFAVPLAPEISACRFCGMPVTYVPSPRSNRKMILSMRTAIEERDDQGRLVSIRAESHWSDCPKQALARKAAAAKKAGRRRRR